MRRVVFESTAFDDFTTWASQDKKIHRKIIHLIKEIQRDPFVGTGKPERLKHELHGYWSRRINHEHRLVYTVTDEEVIIIACRFHYRLAATHLYRALRRRKRDRRCHARRPPQLLRRYG